MTGHQAIPKPMETHRLQSNCLLDAAAPKTQMKKIRSTIATFSLAITLPISAATVFTENFDTYAPGSNLLGQGGWVEAGLGGTSVVTINPGHFLSTLVMDGRADTSGGLSRENILEHPVALDPTQISTLRFSAYASSIAPPTHNQDVGLVPLGRSIVGSMPDPTGTNYPNTRWGPSRSPQGGYRWDFIAGTNIYYVSGGYDRLVDMRIVVDGFGNRIYGQYDFGGGLQETPHYKVPPGYIAQLNAIQFYVDHRSPTDYTGMEVDDIKLSVDAALKIRVSEIELSWYAESNATYRVDYRSDLTSNVWITLTECVQGAGTQKLIYDRVPVGEPQRFYRIAETDCPPQ